MITGLPIDRLECRRRQWSGSSILCFYVVFPFLISLRPPARGTVGLIDLRGRCILPGHQLRLTNAEILYITRLHRHLDLDSILEGIEIS
jgi:hypothetical protein